MPTPSIRILSDLHYRNCASSIRTLDQIAPLFEGVDQVVLNGDALDEERPDSLAEAVDEFRAFLASRPCSVTAIAGNHDLDLSDQSEISYLDGRIWITHGDVLFPNIIPWSTHLGVLKPRIEAFLAAIPPAERNTIETRFRVMRATCRDLGREYNVHSGGWPGRLSRFMAAVFPPTRLVAILRTWWTTPRLAANLAAAQRPAARFILIGHTHRAGVWQLGNRCVINTGAFCPPNRAQMVDFDDRVLRVRKVIRRSGRFHPGPSVAEFPLLAPAGR